MMKKIVSLLAVGMLTLSGCSIGTSTEKQLSDSLSKMNDAEAGYRNNQSKLTALEQNEQKTFTETMELTKEDIDALRKNVAELEKLLEDRLALLEEEETSMKEAEEFTDEFDAIADKASESVKDKIADLGTSIQKRYDKHKAFVNEYRKLSSIQKEFYSMLSNEDVKLADLQQKVEEINGQNSVVQTTISEFNELTKEINSSKEELFSSLEKEG